MPRLVAPPVAEFFEAAAGPTAGIPMPLVPVLGPPRYPGNLPDEQFSVWRAEDALNRLHTAQRALHGLPPLLLDGRLGASAVAWTRDEADADFLGHYGSDQSTPWSRVQAAGFPLPDFSYASENVGECSANDPDPASDIMAAWMSSPGHRANVLNPAWTHVGAGWVKARSGNVYFCIDFGRIP